MEAVRPAPDLSKIDAIIAKYGVEPAATIPMLQAMQAAYGYLPLEGLQYLCSKTRLLPREIYGVATFYAQFRLQPVGENLIKVCHGTACHVQGAEHIDQIVYDLIGIKDGETTTDGKYTLEKVACLGCCSLSPVIMINETVYGKLNRSKLEKIFKPKLSSSN